MQVQQDINVHFYASSNDANHNAEIQMAAVKVSLSVCKVVET